MSLVWEAELLLAASSEAPHLKTEQRRHVDLAGLLAKDIQKHLQDV